MSTGQRFTVERAALSKTRIETFDVGAALAPGQARLRIERFAFTANNITYAVFGESMHYWRFFPADDAAWGCVPVWGYATVQASACDGLGVGERCFGYWPMATHLVVQPASLGSDGFVDASEHRAALPAVYNRYQRVPARDANDEGVYATLRPLFATAWLIADFMQQADDFGARRVLLSSASSKTAWATAFCLKRRAASAVQVTAVTSPSRIAFTTALGVYDSVIAYDALTSLSGADAAVYIDFSGDAALRRAVHEHWQDALAYSCSVGGTHHAALGSGSGLPGPKPQLFFAPTQMQRRAAPPPQGLGRAGLAAAIDEAWRAFAARAGEGASPWLAIEHRHGVDAMRAAFLETLEGRADASRGLMLSF